MGQGQTHFFTRYLLHKTVLILVAASSLSGCERSADRTVSSQKSLAETAAVWPESKLVACFDDNANAVFTPEEKKIIQDAATDQYTPDRTGISFIGWESCAEDKPHQVKLFKATPPDPDACAADPKKCRAPASFGLTSIFDKTTDEFLSFGLGHARKIKILDENGVAVPGKVRYEAIDTSKEYAISDVLLEFDQYCTKERMKISREECIRGLALHELGHVAGLQHEHYREEAKEDQVCLDSPNKRTKADLGKDPSETAVRIGDYDSKSIMNYCHMDAYENGLLTLEKIELSEGDQETLRALYNVKPAPTTAM
jgi:hypothetical protein